MANFHEGFIALFILTEVIKYYNQVSGQRMADSIVLYILKDGLCGPILSRFH
jgi:hypothetical protein